MLLSNSLKLSYLYAEIVYIVMNLLLLSLASSNRISIIDFVFLNHKKKVFYIKMNLALSCSIYLRCQDLNL